MSLIADFYVIPTPAVPRLIEAATPERTKGWFGLTYAEDRFHSTLHAISQDIMNWDRGGYPFLPLFEYLKETHGIDMHAFMNGHLACALHEARHDRDKPYLSFTHPEARQLIARLDTVPQDLAAFRCFATEWANDPELGDVILEALRSLIRCLAEVKEDSVGLFYVG